MKKVATLKTPYGEYQRVCNEDRLFLADKTAMERQNPTKTLESEGGGACD
jgi:hypothetical protein